MSLADKRNFLLQIQPDLRELMETMNRMSNMPPDSEAKDKVNLWSVSISTFLAFIIINPVGCQILCSFGKCNYHHMK